MNIQALQSTVTDMQVQLYQSIQTASYNGKSFADGLKAKEALIRSATLIQRIHEAVKQDFVNTLNAIGVNYVIHPALGSPSPELDVWGLIKKKKQDVVIRFGRPQPEIISEGPLAGSTDKLGRSCTKECIVIGVRSQLSSVNKNFDTLMERAFAETQNLRMRHPQLVMGEAYLLPVREFDEQLMLRNEIGFKPNLTNVERFVKTFNGITHRDDPDDLNQSYKYERSTLILVDFSVTPVKVYQTHQELVNDGIINVNSTCNYDTLSPVNFAKDIYNVYQMRQGLT